MAEYLIQDTTLTALGDAIRQKTGGTELILPSDMPAAVESISDMEPLFNKTISKVSSESATEIRAYFFYGCTNLADVYFPNVESVDARSFYNCTSLQYITPQNFPKLKSFSGEQSFYGCTSLTEVDLPLLETLRPYAFQNCSKIESVNLPLLKSVPSNTFRVCVRISTLKFPKATLIGDYAFYNDQALEALILPSETICELIGTTNVFYNTPIANGTGYIYVPSALIEDYKAATNWTVYATQFRAIEDYPEICGGV